MPSHKPLIRAGVGMLCLSFIGCSARAQTVSEAEPSDFFTAKFALISPVANGPDEEQFFFIFKPDAIVVADPLLNDSARDPHQRTLYLTTLGKMKCTDRENPPIAPGWKYYQRCARLVLRTANSFVMDYTSHAIGPFGAQNEFRRQGTLRVQISNNTCYAQLSSVSRSYANNPNVLTPLSVVNSQCFPLRNPT